MIHVDDSELRTLEVDLRGAGLRVQMNATTVLRGKVGPLLQREMRKDARGHRQLRRLPKSIDWEMNGNWEVEAGVRRGQRGTQGRLAHIIVYGSVNNAPVYDHGAALRRAAPRAINWLADAAEESVLGND